MAFGILALLCTLGIGATTGVAWQQAQEGAARAIAQPATDRDTLASVAAQPHVLLLQTDGDIYRRLAIVPLNNLDGPRYLTDLQCQRVHFREGEGLCLGHNYVAGQKSAYGAYTFNASYQPVHPLTATGLPSRVRVSPDGRIGSLTEFVTGHSYAEAGFSTLTTLVSLSTGESLGDLETFTIWRDGERFQSVDFNFWGVTFANDNNEFFATLGSGGQTYLIRGDLATRQATVLRENAECPSLSPDNSRLVFKKRIAGNWGQPVTWRLHALDLTTMQETALSETRNVDDQVEWLDNQHILYQVQDEGPPVSLRPDIWLLPLTDGGVPRRIQTGAMSPSVVH